MLGHAFGSWWEEAMDIIVHGHPVTAGGRTLLAMFSRDG